MVIIIFILLNICISSVDLDMIAQKVKGLSRKLMLVVDDGIKVKGKGRGPLSLFQVIALWLSQPLLQQSMLCLSMASGWNKRRGLRFSINRQSRLLPTLYIRFSLLLWTSISCPNAPLRWSNLHADPLNLLLCLPTVFAFYLFTDLLIADVKNI